MCEKPHDPLSLITAVNLSINETHPFNIRAKTNTDSASFPSANLQKQKNRSSVVNSDNQSVGFHRNVGQILQKISKMSVSFHQLFSAS